VSERRGFGKNGLSFFWKAQWLRRRQAADAAVQILHLFEADRKKVRTMGRKAASSLAVHEYLQAHPLTKIGPAAKDLKLSVPTVTSALETLAKLKIAKESTGKRRDRLFANPKEQSL
jgi:Fic family protein